VVKILRSGVIVFKYKIIILKRKHNNYHDILTIRKY